MATSSLNKCRRSRNPSTRRELLDAKAIQAGYGIYRGSRSVTEGAIKILPFRQFTEQLFAGKILPD